MKKRFIVLVDFSDHAKHLLVLVNAWAKIANAEMVLVHQVTKPVPALGDAEIISRLKQAQRDEVLEQLKLFTGKVIGNDGTIHFHVDTSHLVSMIESLEAPDTVDYIFVGMNDKSATDRLFLGNTASELTKQLDKIILAFPAAKTDISVDCLYVAVKEKYSLNEQAFQSLVSITKSIIHEIQFFSAIRPGENREAAEKYLHALKESYGGQIDTSYTIFTSEKPVDTVKKHMLKNQGFLVIQKGSRTLADVFRKFWTTEMIISATIPIIILPNTNTKD